MSVTFGDGSGNDKGITVAANGSDITITLGTKTKETYTADEITQAVRDFGKTYAAQNAGDADKKAVGEALTTFTMKADGPVTAAAGAGLTMNKATLADAAAGAGGLTLQIGDTAATHNKLNVTIGDCHITGLKINDVDIGTQDGAAAAIQKIKDAINTVSGTRGDLGALQNRLEHTSNNLSVMTENIQDAESTIRDTDVADEMMAYTKNNILVQSAQAMLAQANQVPQGVLQLLQ